MIGGTFFFFHIRGMEKVEGVIMEELGCLILIGLIVVIIIPFVWPFIIAALVILSIVSIFSSIV